MDIKLQDHVSLADLEGGTVLLNEQDGRYWQLNVTGAFILRSLLDHSNPAQVATMLTVRFGIPCEEATHDISALIDSLLGARLVTT